MNAIILPMRFFIFALAMTFLLLVSSSDVYAHGKRALHLLTTIQQSR